MTLNMPYEEVIDRIAAETDLSKDEIIKRINDKVNELGGLITLEGAAHIIARELEINLYDSQQIQKLQPTKIIDLIDGMNNVTITALIKNIYEPKSFTRKDGTQGAVQNILLVDKTGFCRLVLWDDQIRQFSDAQLSRGDLVRIIGTYVKESKYDGVKELSLSSRSQIESDLKNVKKEEFPNSLLSKQKIEDLALDQIDVELIGMITAIKPVNIFTKKDGTEGKVASIEIADETGKIKITLWDQKTDLINFFKINDIIEIEGGYTRQGLNDSIELHMGKNGSINKNSKIILDIPNEILESQSTIVSTGASNKQPSEEVTLSNLNENMRNISIIARITGISSIKEFDKKDGTTSVVGSLLVKDNTGPGRITFWNSMTDYIKQVKIGDVIRIEGAYVRSGLRGEPEVHVGNNSIVEINPEYLTDAIPELNLKYLEINDITPENKDINLKAMVMNVQELHTFENNDGTEGHVLNIGISDNSGSTRLVAWGKKAIELENLEEMIPIEILHGYAKEGSQGVEVHLGSISSVQKLKKSEASEFSNLKKQEVQFTQKAKANRIDMVDLEENNFSEIRGTILKVYEGKMYYHSCPDCRRKVEENQDSEWHCDEHGLIEPEKTVFVSIALDDGTGCVRVTFFREIAEQLLDISAETLIDELENTGIQQLIVKLEQRLKGREIIVRGKVKKNKFDDGMDVIASYLEDSDPKAEIDIIKQSLKV